jgi:hypothetical protein
MPPDSCFTLLSAIRLPMMIRSLLFVTLLTTLSAQQCKRKPESNSNNTASTMNATSQPDPAKQLYRTWLHSREEDEGEVMVYRPNDFAFPPSRGRTGFAFEAGGKFTQYDIAPTDGLEGNPGKWEMKDAKTIVISGIKDQPGYTLEIVSMDAKMLKVKRRDQ